MCIKIKGMYVMIYDIFGKLEISKCSGMYCIFFWLWYWYFFMVLYKEDKIVYIFLI